MSRINRCIAGFGFRLADSKTRFYRGYISRLFWVAFRAIDLQKQKRHLHSAHHYRPLLEPFGSNGYRRQLHIKR